MAEFAPVCPPELLTELIKSHVDGHYHLLLAHDICERKAEYARIFGGNRKLSASYASNTVILDNSVVELGDAVNVDFIIDAAEVCNPDVIVLPDVYTDGPATVQAVKEALDTWILPISRTPRGRYIRYMIVPQGKTRDEFIDCAYQLATLTENYTEVCWWGIPRNYREQNIGSRQDAVKICYTFGQQKFMHLLGFSNDLVDDLFSARSPYVRGIDSAVPLRAATQGIEFTMTTKLGPRGDWWEHPGKVTELTLKNLKNVRKWI